ncbi:MAG: valine--tRNA ligase [Eubacteriales bacterium]|nr:valine--tRNA ligase [Eubacteriales bacterium]
MQEMEKNFDPKQYEEQLYAQWMDKGYFHDEPDANKKPFTIVIPPPNITAQLHIGHALNNTLQDILTRYKRMEGYCTLWLPGTDHASIATEVKIIEALRKEGLTKQDLGRDEFLKRAWKWYDTYGGRIVEQLKRMGSSCDWQRLRFTMDDGLSHAVNEVFVRLYEKGLIYRGSRIINWCPTCKTALSTAEVEYEEQASHLWHLRYPLADGSGYIVVATTRPETMLGDTAVAVNPADERYTQLVGKTVLLPIMNREIPIVADDYVEYEFGTGAVKITPAHDPNDYELAQRHNLEMINILNGDGTINDNGGAYCGMTALAAREAIVAEFERLGLLEKIEDYSHNVGVCYRCHHTVEPLISEQWFVAMDSLAKPAIDVVRSGEIKMVPERYERTYYNWMENIRDWCISRQLWWGHRIPAWYCQDCGEMVVARTAPDKCPKCGGEHLKQDDDVLDTWFSSALWPFSTLGWPEKTADLDYFYPTNVLVTAYDIIFFWVARMIFSGLEHMDEIPFDTVLFTGLVRDAQGRKMSKSLGNGIDPIEVIDQYGADALRFALTVGVSAGNDMRFRDEKVEAGRNFANKIWNASRFVLMNLGDEPIASIADVQLDAADRWMLTQLKAASAEISGNLDHYEIGMAAQKVYDFIWSTFCDWYIELAKTRLYNGSEEEKRAARAVLFYTLKACLKLMHPFMPFVTEAIWQHLPTGEETIMRSAWPDAAEIPSFEEDAKKMDDAIEIIRSVRNIRAELKVPTSVKTSLLMAAAPEAAAYLPEFERYIMAQAGVTHLELLPQGSPDPHGTVSAVCAAGTLFLPMKELVDIDKELARLDKELAGAIKDISSNQSRLDNQTFLSKAPAQVVDTVRQTLAAAQERRALLEKRIATLKEI